MPELHSKPMESEFLGIESEQAGFMGQRQVQFHGALLTRALPWV